MIQQALQGHRSIMVILTGSLGDIVRGASIATALKRIDSSIRVSWVVARAFADYIAAHPAVDRTVVFDKKRVAASVAELRRVVREEQVTLVIDAQRILKSALLGAVSGVSLRLGMHPANAKEWSGYFATHRTAYVDESTQGKLALYLALAEAAGGVVTEPVDFGCRGWPVADEYRGITKNDVAVIMGSQWRTKEWPIEGYQRVLESLVARRQQHGRFLLLGTAAQAISCRALESIPGVVNLCGQTSLADLPPILERVGAAFGPDSGPLHIAAAVGTPYVSLFGPTSPAKVRPYRQERLVIQAQVGCASCYRRTCPGLDTICMRSISPTLVTSMILECLESRQ